MTGGTGFVGSHTVEHLLSVGFRVRCQIRTGRKNIGWLSGLSVEIVEADLLDPPSLAPLFQGIDYVFHIAGVTKAKRSQDYFSGNVTTTKNLLEAAANHSGIKKFCLTSSLTAVGPSADGTPLDESAPCRPITKYGLSKHQAEKATMSYAGRFPVVIIRPPAVYGPRDRDVLEMFRAAKWGLKPVFGSKDKTLSLIHAADLARGMVSASISEKTAGNIYFATDGRIHRYAELCDELSSIFGRSPVTLPVPNPILYSIAAVVEVISLIGPRPAVLGIDKARDLVQPHWVCSGEKIKRDIGFSTEISIREGLRSTYEWYKARGWLSLRTMFGFHS